MERLVGQGEAQKPAGLVRKLSLVHFGTWRREDERKVNICCAMEDEQIASDASRKKGQHRPLFPMLSIRLSTVPTLCTLFLNPLLVLLNVVYLSFGGISASVGMYSALVRGLHSTPLAAMVATTSSTSRSLCRTRDLRGVERRHGSFLRRRCKWGTGGSAFTEWHG